MHKAVVFGTIAAVLLVPLSHAFAQLRVVNLNASNSVSSSSGPRTGMGTILLDIGARVSDDPTTPGNTGIAKPIDILFLQESFSSTIEYFLQEGKANLRSCLRIAFEAAIARTIDTIVIFTGIGEGPEGVALGSSEPAASLSNGVGGGEGLVASLGLAGVVSGAGLKASSILGLDLP